MNISHRHLIALMTCSLLVLLAGCSDRDTAGLPAAEGNTAAVVFDDGYAEDVYFQPFFETHITAARPDSVYAFGGLAQYGARSLKFNVPGPGSSLGIYTGGVITSGAPRDLNRFNALSMYVRTNATGVSLGLVGFGNDNTGTSQFEAGRSNFPMTGEWQRVLVPIPDAQKLRSERGLFTISQAPDARYPEGYDIWIDQIEYVNLPEIVISSFAQAQRIDTANKETFVGARISVTGARTIYDVSALGLTLPTIVVNHAPAYFSLVSSAPDVAVVEGSQVRLVGTGEATITATSGEREVSGSITVQGYAAPATGAPAPAHPAGDVVSLFSDAYDDVPVQAWLTPDWAFVTTELEEYAVGGNTAKLYSSFSYTGILFKDPLVNAEGMTHLHMDVFLADGAEFAVELGYVDEGGAVFATGGLAFDGTTTPAVTEGQWSSLEIPLADFVLPEGGWDWSRLGQMVISSGVGANPGADLLLIDNVYFHR